MEKYGEYRKWTATNSFIVPTLGIGRHHLNGNGLENAYIMDEVKNIPYERGVYLLFRPMYFDKFENFLESERKRAGAIIMDEYDYPDGYTMVVYQYAEKFKFDVEKILEGKFSTVSKDFQDAIQKTIKTQIRTGVYEERPTFQHQVFGKDQRLKAFWWQEYGLEFDDYDEVWEHYPERETFTQNTLDTLLTFKKEI